MDQTSYPVPATAVALPFLALLTLILDTPPLIWHVRNHNIAAASLVLWFMIENLINFINPLIWPTDDLGSWFHGYGFCDIQVKIIPASYIGVVGSLIGIMRHLARILDAENTVLAPTKAQKQRQRCIDIFLCLVFPCMFMVFHYIVQESRFWILTVVGCYTTYHLSWMSVVLIFMWPPILSLFVVYYCVLVIHRMRKYRRDFSSVLSSQNSNMTKNRFMRLFCMSVTLILVIIPAQTYVLLDFVKRVAYPYSWSVVHGPDWNKIVLMPTLGAVTPDHWIQIVVGFLLFVFFGLGHDAQEMYRKCLLSLGMGRYFPSLRRSSRERRRLKNLTGSQTSSQGTRVSLFKKKFSRPSFGTLHKSKWSRSKSTSSSSPTLKEVSTAHPSPRSDKTGYSGSTFVQPMTATAQHLLEPMPAVHNNPSRFHNFFHHANATASDRRMAGGLGLFGAPMLPRHGALDRYDPTSSRYDPI